MFFRGGGGVATQESFRGGEGGGCLGELCFQGGGGLNVCPYAGDIFTVKKRRYIARID